MSTKSSLAYSEGSFHLYHDLVEESQDVFLQLTDPEAEVRTSAGHTTVTLRIPAAIWETIRQHGEVSTMLAGFSDSEIEGLVRTQVQKRIHEYEASGRDDRVGLAGALTYGLPSAPFEEQVRYGVEQWRRERDQHNEIAAQLERLRKKDAPERSSE